MLRGGEEKKLIPSCQGKFRLDFRKHFVTPRVVQPWHSLPRAVVQPPSIWSDLKHVDVALGEWFSGEYGSVGVAVGFEDL